MKYAVEMGSAAIHTKFYKDWFRNSQVNGGGSIHRNRESMEIA
jgi:hypothetical protein